MPITAIRTAPVKEDYTSLEEHQSRTPETFFGGRPILHAHVQGASAWLQRSGRAARGLSAMFPNAGPCGAGQGQQQPEHVLRAQRVDVFVGSELVSFCISLSFLSKKEKGKKKGARVANKGFSSTHQLPCPV